MASHVRRARRTFDAMNARWVAVGFVVLFLSAGCFGDSGSSSNPGTAREGDSATNAPPTATPTPQPNVERIRASGRLRVGVKFDQPGFGYKDPTTGELDGFDIAVAQEIAKEFGLKSSQVEFVETPSTDRIPALADGRVDIVVATMAITRERGAFIDFSRPYYLAGQSILVRKDADDIDGIDSLNGRKVCSVEGSGSATTVEAMAPHALLLPLRTYADCVAALKSKVVDAVTTEDTVLAAFATADHDLKMVGGQFTREPYAVAVKQGQPDVVHVVNDAIAGMLEDGTWDKIYERYLGDAAGMPSASRRAPTVAGGLRQGLRCGKLRAMRSVNLCSR